MLECVLLGLMLKKDKVVNRIIKNGPLRLFVATKVLLLISGCFMVNNLWSMNRADFEAHRASMRDRQEKLAAQKDKDDGLTLRERIQTRRARNKARKKAQYRTFKLTNNTPFIFFVKVKFPEQVTLPFRYKLHSKIRSNQTEKIKKNTKDIRVENLLGDRAVIQIRMRDKVKLYKRSFEKGFFDPGKEYSIIEKDSIAIDIEEIKKGSRGPDKVFDISLLSRNVKESEYGSFENIDSRMSAVVAKRNGSFIEESEKIRRGSKSVNGETVIRFRNKSEKKLDFYVSSPSRRDKTETFIVDGSDYFGVKFKNEYFDKNKKYSIIFRSSSDRGIYKISDLKSGVIYEISIVPFDIL